MPVVIQCLVGVIALEHVAFLVLEMFLWRQPIGLKIFRLKPEVAEVSATLAANQGLYNGFLAAGLGWSLVVADPAQARALQLFFLGCVAAAGAYGGWSVNRRIFVVQALPALVGLAALVCWN